MRGSFHFFDNIKSCPFSKTRSIKKTGSLLGHFYGYINFLGLRYLRRFWLFQYFGPIYPGVLPHFSSKGLKGKLWHGHRQDFHKTTVLDGKSASHYFLESGLSDFAEKHGGVCTFWMGFTQAIYQNTNVPLVQDEWLSAPTDQNRNLFGDFMGTLPLGTKERNAKRAAIESSLGSQAFMESIRDDLIDCLRKLLSKAEEKPISLEDFCREVIADLDSLTPGVLDFHITPLSTYLKAETYKSITTNFFDIASDVISKMEKGAVRRFETITPFVRQVLIDNLESLQSSSRTNIVKRYFKIWDIPLTLEAIQTLPDSYLKELGTLIVAIYDTTSLSLMWAISYIEHNPLIKKNVIKDAKSGGLSLKNMSYIDYVVFEAIRLGGSNPAALWRKTVVPFELIIGHTKIAVQPGTMLWLDRRKANQDKSVFPNPNEFDPNNIISITSSAEETMQSLMSRNRYEINSFSMVNTKKNPRKCPGRLFSVYVQSLLLRLLYSSYNINLKENDTDLRLYSAMPKPSSPGVIFLSKIKENNGA